MAFCSHDLSVLAYANGFTLWHYRTGDSLPTLLGDRTGLETNPYFATADELLRPGDQIIVTLAEASGPGLVNLVVKSVGRSGTVSVGRL
jgi:hypothetical protein